MLNKRQFPSPADVPPEYGTKPVPPGAIRFNHYTGSVEQARSIAEHGLEQKYAEESYARGGTEYPQNFATAGQPSEDLLRNRPVIEGYAFSNQLDTGDNYTRQPEEQWAASREQNKSVVTFRGDLPPTHVLAVHEPWHSTYRYLQNDPSMERGVMAGDYDNINDDATAPAIAATKAALAAKVMVGGKLQGSSWEDEGLPTERNPHPRKRAT